MIENISFISAELVLIIGSILLLLFGVTQAGEKKPKGFYLYSCLIIVLIAIAASFALLKFAGVICHNNGQAHQVFGGLIAVSCFIIKAKIALLVVFLLAILFAASYVNKSDSLCSAEFSVLILLSAAGMMFLISAENFLVFYLSIELQSLCLYVLAAIARNNPDSAEAGMKYFTMGALLSCVSLLGVSFIYGSSSSTSFELVSLFIQSHNPDPLLLIGLVLFFCGVFFKLSAAPFHAWAPDVYQGSLLPVSAIFATSAKMAAAIIIAKLYSKFAINPSLKLGQIIAIVAIFSLFIGSLGAIMQRNIKRLIAYSSIGHVGYMLIGLFGATDFIMQNILLYTVIYSVNLIGLFALISAMENIKATNQLTIDDFKNLSKSQPLMAIALAVILFSMAGIPPFAGFFAKFYILKSAITTGKVAIATIGLLFAVVASFYYIRLVKLMYFDIEQISDVKNPQNFCCLLDLIIVTITIMFNILFVVSPATLYALIM